MQKLMGRLAVVLAALAVSVAVAAEEKEEKIALDKLPKAVVKAVKAKFPKAKLVSAELENEKGKKVYEVNIKVGKTTIEVTLTPKGEIVSIEKEIAADDVPKAVADALAAKYPKATIKKIEEITKEDKVTAYEFLIVTADEKKLEVSFDPKGKLLEEEKKGGEKKEEKKGDK